MKTNMVDERINVMQTLYEDQTGFIKGYKQSDGYYWIEQFYIFPAYRGHGLARKPAKKLPQQSRLVVCPIAILDNAPKLSTQQLVNFYTFLGFTLYKDVAKLVFMQRC
jgi:GNAT superfamily N-acetyltransferase